MSRMERVNQQIKREVSKIIQEELSDPRLMMVTITRVDTSKDLRHCKVFFSVLGDDKKREDAQQSLDNATGMIRKILAHSIKMRNTPEPQFLYDELLDSQIRIAQQLEDIHEKNSENS